ncbi:MAG: beta-ketoacyl synthase N-terminal-like domain-containing protein, partial [Pseudomonadota bacterium]
GVTGAQELMLTMANRLQRPIWVKALREMGYAEDEVQKAADRIAEGYVPWQESTFPGLLGNVVAGRIANRLDLGGTNCVTDAACASLNKISYAYADKACTVDPDNTCDTVETVEQILVFNAQLKAMCGG